MVNLAETGTWMFLFRFMRKKSSSSCHWHYNIAHKFCCQIEMFDLKRARKTFWRGKPGSFCNYSRHYNGVTILLTVLSPYFGIHCTAVGSKIFISLYWWIVKLCALWSHLNYFDFLLSYFFWHKSWNGNELQDNMFLR